MTTEVFVRLKPGPGHGFREVANDQEARLRKAILELTAESGFDAVTLRQLTCLAGVSSRSFYELFDAKEDCFCSAYDEIVDSSVRSILRAQRGETDWEARLQTAFSVLTALAATNPAYARAVLGETVAVGPIVASHVERATGLFAAILFDCFRRSSGANEFPHVLLQGIVAGAAEMMATHLRAGANLFELGGELTEWSRRYCAPPSIFPFASLPAKGMPLPQSESRRRRKGASVDDQPAVTALFESVARLCNYPPALLDPRDASASPRNVRDLTIKTVRERLTEPTESSQLFSGVQGEASLAAVTSLLCGYLDRGPYRSLPTLISVAVYLALVPSVGAEVAASAILSGDSVILRR